MLSRLNVRSSTTRKDPVLFVFKGGDFMTYQEYLDRLSRGEFVTADDIDPDPQLLAEIGAIGERRAAEIAAREAEAVAEAELADRVNHQTKDYDSRNYFRSDPTKYDESMTAEERAANLETVKRETEKLEAHRKANQGLYWKYV